MGATIPIDDIYIFLFVSAEDLANSDNASNIKLLGLMKLVRLLRLGRIIRYLNFKQGAVLGMTLFMLLSGLVMIVHWIGCVWYLMIKDGDWVPPKELDYPLQEPGNLYSKSNFYEESITFQYATVFYYAVLTMMGNEIAPRNTTQTVVAACIILVGVLSGAIIFGNMYTVIESMNAKSAKDDAEQELASNTMRSMKLEDKTQYLVMDFLEKVQSDPALQHDKTILAILNDPLRR